MLQSVALCCNALQHVCNASQGVALLGALPAWLPGPQSKYARGHVVLCVSTVRRPLWQRAAQWCNASHRVCVALPPRRTAAELPLLCTVDVSSNAIAALPASFGSQTDTTSCRPGVQ
jgi:hypothetical protein